MVFLEASNSGGVGGGGESDTSRETTRDAILWAFRMRPQARRLFTGRFPGLTGRAVPGPPRWSPDGACIAQTQLRRARVQPDGQSRERQP